MNQLAVVLVFLPVIVSIVIYLSKWRHMNIVAIASQLALTIVAVVYFTHFYGDFESTHIVLGGWDSRIGISLANDELSMSFIFLSLFSWWMVLIYTFRFGHTEHSFLFFLIFLQGVFLGLLQSNDLFNVFVFLELATIIVTILIAYNKKGESFRSALYYLIVNVPAMLVFLTGIILVYFTFGSINIVALTEQFQDVDDTIILRFSYVLMMAGISVKAALFPVFTWLPKAHGVAQSAISALLSGLIVKAGVYLFFRMNFLYEGAGFAYSDFFFIVGVLTAISGVMFALSQKELKQILAFHTISQVGIIMMGVSSADSDMFYGGILHTFNHALFKSLLFLGAGVIIQVYRTKKVGEIRGVFKTMPVVSIFMIVGMLSITGAPFFNGFISKSIIKYGLAEQGWRYWALYVINIGTATSFIKMSQIFFGPKTLSYPLKNMAQNVAMMALAFGCVLLGNFYIPFSEGFFGIRVEEFDLTSFDVLLDYGITVAIGLVFYFTVIARDLKPVRMIRESRISFENANLVFLIYIVALTTYFVFLS